MSWDGSSLAGRMLRDVHTVPKPKHQLVVRYTRMSSQAVSPRRARARKVQSTPCGGHGEVGLTLTLTITITITINITLAQAYALKPRKPHSLSQRLATP